jgi:CheY-like chemotaxis protein
MTKTILVVDDDREIRETLEDVLRDEGYAVMSAANGHDALIKLPLLQRPCAIVLDLIMPLMSGREFYEAMCSDRRFMDIPVIVSTSDPTRSPSGLTILRKPLSLPALLAAVRKFFPDSEPSGGRPDGGSPAPGRASRAAPDDESPSGTLAGLRGPPAAMTLSAAQWSKNIEVFWGVMSICTCPEPAYRPGCTPLPS